MDITAPVKPPKQGKKKKRGGFFLRLLGFVFAACMILSIAVAGAVAFVLWKVSQELPDYENLARYEPPVMTRIHADDGRLIVSWDYDGESAWRVDRQRIVSRCRCRADKDDQGPQEGIHQQDDHQGTGECDPQHRRPDRHRLTAVAALAPKVCAGDGSRMHYQVLSTGTGGSSLIAPCRWAAAGDASRADCQRRLAGRGRTGGVAGARRHPVTHHTTFLIQKLSLDSLLNSSLNLSASAREPTTSP